MRLCPHLITIVPAYIHIVMGMTQCRHWIQARLDKSIGEPKFLGQPQELQIALTITFQALQTVILGTLYIIFLTCFNHTYTSRFRSGNKRAVASTHPRHLRDASIRPRKPLSGFTGSNDSGGVVNEENYTSMETQATPRSHPLYQNVLCGSDGLYHCPWETEYPLCNHKPDKLKCNYE
jgi:hypothetical protein